MTRGTSGEAAGVSAWATSRSGRPVAPAAADGLPNAARATTADPRRSLRTAPACQRSMPVATMLSGEGVAAGARSPRPKGAHLVRVVRGVLGAIRAHPRLFLAVAAAVVALSILGPPAVLSVARQPVDYFTVNPWLRRLPAYVLSPAVPLGQKVDKLPDLALFWFSSDSPYGVDWGFAVDVTDLARILLMAALFGAYFALLAQRREQVPVRRAGMISTRRGGLAGMLTSVVGLSTGPCSVMGCGAPMIPVVGLAFAGLSSGTLAFLASLSRVTTALVLVALAVAVVALGWRTGEAPRAPAAAPSARSPRAAT